MLTHQQHRHATHEWLLPSPESLTILGSMASLSLRVASFLPVLFKSSLTFSLHLPNSYTLDSPVLNSQSLHFSPNHSLKLTRNSPWELSACLSNRDWHIHLAVGPNILTPALPLTQDWLFPPFFSFYSWNLQVLKQDKRNARIKPKHNIILSSFLFLVSYCWSSFCLQTIVIKTSLSTTFTVITPLPSIIMD